MRQKLTGKGESSNLLSEFDVRDTSWFMEVTFYSEEKSVFKCWLKEESRMTGNRQQEQAGI